MSSENLGRLEAEAKAKAKRMADEFQMKVDGLKERISALEREKTTVRDGKVSLTEGVERMKQDLKRGFDQWVRGKFIEPVLRTYASGHYRPFENYEHMKTHLLHNTEWLFFIFGWVTPGMVDEVAAGLEWDGPSLRERETKIADLDKQINQLVKEMESLLK